MPRRKTQTEFVNEATSLHQGFYSYEKSVYQNMSKKVVITCPTHGDFQQTPRGHLVLKQGCPMCVPDKLKAWGRIRAKTTPQFIQEAKHVHGDAYDYSLVNYVDTHTKVVITCPTHGTFEQTPNSHIDAAAGCPKCWKARRGEIKHPGGYSAERFTRDPDFGAYPGVLYLVEYTGENHHFYKIGITRRSVHERLKRSNKHGMKTTILKQWYMSISDAFTLEQRLINQLKEHQYWPNSRIGGFTECFKPTEHVLTTICRECG